MSEWYSILCSWITEWRDQKKGTFAFGVNVFISPTLALSIVPFIFYDLRIYVGSILFANNGVDI